MLAKTSEGHLIQTRTWCRGNLNLAWTLRAMSSQAHKQMLQPRSIVGALCWTHSYRTTLLPMCPYKSCVEEIKHFLSTCWPFFCQYHHTVILDGCKDSLLIHVQVFIYENSQALLAELPPGQSFPSLDCCMELFHSRFKVLHCFLLDFMNFLILLLVDIPFLYYQLVPLFWCRLKTLLGLCFVPLSGSLVKMLNSVMCYREYTTIFLSRLCLPHS